MAYPYRSFREWIDEEEQLGNVLRIRRPIKCGDYNHLVEVDVAKDNPGIPEANGLLKEVVPETEMRALVAYLHSLPGSPIGIIENPIDNRPDIPLVVNPWPSYERTLRGMGLKSKFEFGDILSTITKKRVKPVVVSKAKAPCKEVVIRDVDLRKDIPRPWVEFNKLCFAGCNGTIISYDPKLKTHGLTKTRLGVFDWDNGDPKQAFPEERQKKYGFATMARPGRPGQGMTGRYYFSNYREKGKNWPAVYVYGLPTDMHVVAATKILQWPETGDEYEMVGGLRNEPVELVESETVPGLMVPASAEWVIEGEFINEDYTTPEFSEDLGSGFVWGKAIWPVFKVTCITHRKFPLWDGTTFSSLSTRNHDGTHQGLLLGMYECARYGLRKMGHKVKDVVLVAVNTMVVQLEVDGKDKPHPGYGLEVGLAAGGAKVCIVVGPDIDPNNLAEVLWAVSMRAPRNQWYDLKPPPGVPEPPRYGMFTDIPEATGRTVIDATIQVPEMFDKFPPRTEPTLWETEAIERMRKLVARLD